MVEKVGIIILPEVIDYLDKLVFKLYQKEYFGFIEDAENYVLKIYNDIETNINLKKHQTTPTTLIKFGKNFISYKANNKTSWYIFFDKKDNRYLVKYITNNHEAKAQFLNKL